MLLPTNSSKEKKDDQCLACYLWCLPSAYDIVTCSQQKIKDLGGGGGGAAWYVTTCPCGVFSGDGSNMRDKYLSPVD